jgi:membrane-associated phospholipid phosphatase
MILLLNESHTLIFRKLLDFDHWLFWRINRHWTNSFFDTVLPFARQPEFWIPLYLFLLLLATLNFGRKGWLWCAALIMTAIMSDLFSSHLIKMFIFRYRPCRNPEIGDQVRVLVNYCPGSSSFTSSHACNHFAIAVFIYITLNQSVRWCWPILLWAALISYAQVYVGVHYPLDVAGGALFGTLIGYAMSVLFKKQFGTISLK